MIQPEERDFGDSAGYGSGGSNLDYHEVGDRDQVRKPNPLDAVMPPKTEDKPAGPHASEALTDHERTPGAGTLPSATGGDVDAGAG